MRREKSAAPRVRINADKLFSGNTTTISIYERHVSDDVPVDVLFFHVFIDWPVIGLLVSGRRKFGMSVPKAIRSMRRGCAA